MLSTLTFIPLISLYNFEESIKNSLLSCQIQNTESVVRALSLENVRARQRGQHAVVIGREKKEQK